MAVWNTYHLRPLVAVLAATMLVVALACGGEAATPTSVPTATSQPTATVAAPTATTVAPTATSAVPTATLLPGVPTATATVAATATPVPEATLRPDQIEDWVGYLMSHPGYQAKWGTPQYGGTIRMADPRTATAFNISTGWGAFSKWQYAQYNTLLKMDPWLEMDQELSCDLCESYEVSADGKTMTFKLRKGVKFQSEGWGQTKGAPAESYGAELTCEDVKASMEWFANPPSFVTPSTAQGMRNYLGHLDNVSCPDGAQGYTAVATFKYFAHTTLGRMAIGVPPIWNKEYREWMDKAYPGIQSTANTEGYMINMGTGPWIPTYADSQSVMKNKKNANYFRKGAPFADGFEAYAIQDYNTKFASLVTGKVHQAGHGSSGITKAQVIQVQQSYADKIELHIVRYNHISHLLMNPMKPPFDNWNVRWALQLAADRDGWHTFMTAGAIKMSTPVFGLHPDGGWGIPYEEYSKFPGWRQDKKDEDIAEANRLLDGVFGKGVRPRLEQYIIQLVSRRETSLWSIDFFKKTIGLEFDVKYVDTYGTVQTECLTTIRAEANPTYSQNLIKDPSDAYTYYNHSKKRVHELCRQTGWKGMGISPPEENARIDAMIEELDTSLDVARRRELVRTLELYMVNERTHNIQLGLMNVAWPNRLELKGIHYYGLGTYGQQRLTEYIWLAK